MLEIFESSLQTARQRKARCLALLSASALLPSFFLAVMTKLSTYWRFWLLYIITNGYLFGTNSEAICGEIAGTLSGVPSEKSAIKVEHFIYQILPQVSGNNPAPTQIRRCRVFEKPFHFDLPSQPAELESTS
jgi:hypothetical protein